MTIRTGEQVYHRMPGAGDDHAESILRAHWPAQVPFGLPIGTHPSITAKVEVNLSRWVVRCPWCPSAQVACDTDRRFFCVECLSGGANGQWIPVVWPDDDTRHAIEALLELRPVGNQHWKPGVLFLRGHGWAGPAETVEQLEEENRLQADVLRVPQVIPISSFTAVGRNS
jgi:hypothetical protein